MQLPPPATAGQPAPTTTKEYDATGRYVATYTLGQADASGRAYDKRKVSYEDLIADAVRQSAVYGRNVPPPTIARSSGTLRVAVDRVVSAQLEERLELPLLAGSVLSTETAIKLVTRGQERAPSIERAALGYEKLAASAPYRTKTAQFDFDTLKIGGRGFDDLLTMIEALAKEREVIKPTAARPPKACRPTVKKRSSAGPRSRIARSPRWPRCCAPSRT